MQKIILLLAFLTGSLFCDAQEIKPDNKNVHGKFVGYNYEQNHSYSDEWEFINIKVKKGHRFRSRNFTMTKFTEMSYGKWKLENDTLVLTEKWYRKKPSSFLYASVWGRKFKTKEEPSRKQVTKLVLIQGKWTEMNPATYRFTAIYTQWIRKGCMSYKRFDWKAKNQLMSFL